MSGLEIAGVVLGGLPIIIAALEHYEQALDSVTAFMRWRGGLSSAIASLLCQHAVYTQSLELLLQPITTEGQMRVMIDDWHNSAWTDYEMEEQMKSRLGGAYSSYIRTMSQIETIVEQFTQKLDVEGASKVDLRMLESLVTPRGTVVMPRRSKFNFKQAITFTMSRHKLKRLLEDFDACNRQLDSFANKAERLEQTYQPVKNPKFTAPIAAIERNATNLFHSLRRTWCPGQLSHEVGLLLEKRLFVKKRTSSAGIRHPNTAQSNCFGVFLPRNHSARDRRDVEFQVVEAPLTPRASTPVVRVALPAQSPIRSGTPAPTGANAPPNHLAMAVVPNICSVINKPTCPLWLGFYVDAQGNLRGGYETSPRASAHIPYALSLAQVFDTNHRLSRKDVYDLSVTLSSSMIQLGQTPWSSEPWQNSGIMFLRAKDASAMSIDMRHPYITREHTASMSMTPSHSVKDNIKLLSLGVLLVEVSAGKSIEQLRQPRDLGHNGAVNDMTDLQTARRWITEQKDNGDITPAVYKAIMYCLQSFVDSSCSLGNPDFRATVEEQVLAPLVDESTFLYG